ncbi:MAG: hypothetical protein QMD77_01695 [Patescibacteria group bacterium]|nr:hypothetical protein [Patescibacteria group bacterium]
MVKYQQVISLPMLRKTKKKAGNKKIKIISVSVATFIAVIFGLAVFLNFHKTLAQSVGGWAKGIWNDTVGYDLLGNEQLSGGPSTGWISSNSGTSSCLKGAGYGVNFSGNLGDSERGIIGNAWFGIGSRPDPDLVNGECDSDLPSLGWIDFDAGSPPFCAGLGGGDCYSARWHNDGADYTGYIDGWARVRSLGDNGWARLKGANYGLRSDASGVLSGYAWNSGTEPTIVGNSGLGWIDLTGLKIGECNVRCATKQLCRGSTFSSCDSSFCTGDGASCALGGDGISWACSSSCGSTSCNDNIYWIDPEVGVCGPLDGKSLCDPNQMPTDDNLCANGTTPHNLNRSGIVATWTCGSNQCGGEEVSCSATARCGWIETAP